MGFLGQLQVRNTRRGRADLSWTELSFLDFRVSENLGFLASLLGTLHMAGTAVQVCSGFQAKEWVPPSPRSHPREREKHWQQVGTLDLSNGETLPLPAPCSAPASTHVLWGVESHGGWGSRGVRILCRWGRKRKQQPTFPSWAEPTLQTYIFPQGRIIIPLSSQFGNISPW